MNAMEIVTQDDDLVSCEEWLDLIVVELHYCTLEQGWNRST